MNSEGDLSSLARRQPAHRWRQAGNTRSAEHRARNMQTYGELSLQAPHE
eukprot:CAMPEP_0198572882 /NCGR_PEP_ID=MMETSP1462-20131121/112463_1 /TAXON_ID=1333877 /ORGANISM="Brandtodinium nutriculum, Strain RCC3387" /LENGTH=48 /DNA_ID= /DNA_START= /DNA_END= /DNA_ORIENTATION=